MTATATLVTLIPPTCALCTRPLPVRQRRHEGLQCRCGAIVCRPSDRACMYLHQREEHS